MLPTCWQPVAPTQDVIIILARWIHATNTKYTMLAPDCVGLGRHQNFPLFFAPTNHRLLLPSLPPPPATAHHHPFYGSGGVQGHLMAATMDDSKVLTWQWWQTTTAMRDTTINKQ
jgi:hypothetical protein